MRTVVVLLSCAAWALIIYGGWELIRSWYIAAEPYHDEEDEDDKDGVD